MQNPYSSEVLGVYPLMVYMLLTSSRERGGASELRGEGLLTLLFQPSINDVSGSVGRDRVETSNINLKILEGEYYLEC